MDSKTFTGLMDSVNSVLEGTGYSFSSSGLWLTTSNGSRKMSNFIVVPEEFVTKDSGRSKKEIYGHPANAVSLLLQRYSLTWLDISAVLLKRWEMHMHRVLPFIRIWAGSVLGIAGVIFTAAA